ncbi:hypothetical protein [Candidatus Magnetomonas plexicatena]|uniref:hypothetical protein n=1 Tax=Candidatus Magnetomonas plexicatena TaxID=2552947 RepID=UPI001C778403|nr:hypothetical protein E2O03_005940 [Nitrospirales bacterium LBB_01]
MKKYTANGSYEIDHAKIGISSKGPEAIIQLKPNYDDMQIAYKLWVEVCTRKIGLPIDFKNDVIVEVYNSWYEFFKITRELIKTVPVQKIQQHKSTKDIVQIAIDVLNECVRPHLTMWQAKFRKWYNEEMKKDENNNADAAIKSLSPQ